MESRRVPPEIQWRIIALVQQYPGMPIFEITDHMEGMPPLSPQPPIDDQVVREMQYRAPGLIIELQKILARLAYRPIWEKTAP
jgi:hypothetical protein